MEDGINVAVIGAGYWGKKVLAEYSHLAQTVPNVAVSMVCDMADDTLEHCHSALEIPKDRLARDYKAALESKEVNAVHICTPNETHYPICREALKAGKNVLLEKPMALEARQAWELVGIAKSKGLCLQVGHIFRFNNALKLMRDLVAQEYLGAIYYLKLQWTTLMDSPLKRDIIFDLGPHPIDILNFLLNKWPLKVACKARAYRRATLEELAYITMDFDNDVIAHVELSWLQPGKVRNATLIGSKRSAVVDCVNQSIQIYGNGNGEHFSLPVENNNTILDEAKNFAECIRGKVNNKNEGQSGARNVAILEHLKESLAQEKTIKVDFREEK